MDIQKAYEGLAKKHSLPAFEKVDYEFDVSSIDSTAFLLKEIVRKIRDKMQLYADILNEILQPDTGSFASIHEFRFFDDKDKQEIYDLFKKLMIINRSSYLVEITDGDEELANIIRHSFEQWEEIKKKLPRYIKKMKESWETDVDVQEELGYLG